jgi:MFS family permease
VITRKTVLCLGFAQLVSWGISYYLIGGLGEAMSAGLGWTRSVVYGGFSAALLVMGLTSSLTGRLIDRYGGRPVMIGGALLNAASCLGIAFSDSVPAYYAAWTGLGIAMRLTLYDAAFASLVRAGGHHARRAIAQITLLGGLASTVFWPLGHALVQYFGWRDTLWAYAGFALLTIPLHLAIPPERHDDAAPQAEAGPEQRPLAVGKREVVISGTLYVLIMMLANFLNAGMSSHMLGILAGLGLAASTSVWVSTLRGIGQSSARLGSVLFGRRFHPLTLNVLACALLPLCFAAVFAGGQFILAALAFAFFYGAGNGLLTITRGTLPLALFDHRSYGTFVGRLIAPSFIASAVAPLAYAFVMQRFGETGALVLSIGVASLTLAAALVLKFRYAPSR